MKYGPISAAISAMIKAIANPSSVVCTVSPFEPAPARPHPPPPNQRRSSAIYAIYRDNCGEVTATPRGGLTRRPSPARGQLFEAAQDKGPPPFRISGAGAPQVRQAAQQRRDRDLGLDARQLGAEAKVNAATKRQRTYIGAGDIETIRPVRINSRVAIGRTQQAQHALAFRDFLAAEVVDVLQRHPAAQLHRGVVTQEFLDGIGDEAGLGPEPRELIG